MNAPVNAPANALYLDESNFSLLLNPGQLDNIGDFLTNFNPNFNPIINEGDDYESMTNLINQMGNVEVGLDDINKYTVIKTNSINCPVCRQNSEFVRETSCKHQFCLSCLTEWTKHNKYCPLCMQELNIISNYNI